MSSKTAIVWFRQDLRLKDNQALLHAVHEGYQIIPVYILDDKNAGEWKMGGASRWWLHQRLKALNDSLDGKLVFRSGAADKIIPELVKDGAFVYHKTLFSMCVPTPEGNFFFFFFC